MTPQQAIYLRMVADANNDTTAAAIRAALDEIESLRQQLHAARNAASTDRLAADLLRGVLAANGIPDPTKED